MRKRYSAVFHTGTAMKETYCRKNEGAGKIYGKPIYEPGAFMAEI